MRWHQRKGGFDEPTDDAQGIVANRDRTPQSSGHPLRVRRTFRTLGHSFFTYEVPLIFSEMTYEASYEYEDPIETAKIAMQIIGDLT